jgi:hypothetical protein
MRFAGKVNQYPPNFVQKMIPPSIQIGFLDVYKFVDPNWHSFMSAKGSSII